MGVGGGAALFVSWKEANSKLKMLVQEEKGNLLLVTPVL